MSDGFLLGRTLLEFGDTSDADLTSDLSAVALTPDGSLWLGSDEHLTLERLTPMGGGIYGNHKNYPLNDFIDLPDTDSEIDIEGLDYAGGYLWVIGSHSLKRNKPKGKNLEKDFRRLAEIKTDPNRYLLARLPVLNGELVRTYARTDRDEPLSPAMLPAAEDGGNVLMDALAADDHLGPFLKMRLPSKENGLDIEGLAVRGDRIFLGLRGPVLRGWAIILELQVEKSGPGTLSLANLENSRPYRKHFLDLDGRGIRELCFAGEDLLVLAGPTMDLDGFMQLFRLKGISAAGGDALWDRDSGKLAVAFDLPYTPGADKAEGLALFPHLGYDNSLLVVYDSPHDRRLPRTNAIFADIFLLPDR